MINQVDTNSNSQYIYDLTLVNKMCRGKQELVLKLMKVFILQVSKSIEELTLASQEGNIEKIRNELHKVKPMLAYYGTRGIEKELLIFENMVLDHFSTEEIETRLKLLNKITQQTVANMKTDFGISNN